MSDRPPPRQPTPLATAGTIITGEAGGTSEPPVPALPTNADPEATLRPPESSGPGVGAQPVGYAMLHELGRGGMGAVHAAEQRAFARRVAIKTLLLDGEVARRGFWAESAATAILEHPNIIPVHDLLVGKDGLPRLVMKLVEGTTWKRLLHPRTDEEKARVAEWDVDHHLEILLKVCDAIAFAHTRGILHRDLKPENVMVGGFGEVLVMDWGCAVALGDTAPHPLIPLARGTRLIIGTPAYMAPEQARGDGTQLGPWTDVYLLGAILYEILTGTPPHRGRDAQAVLAMARVGRIEHPDERAPERAIPEELATLAIEALAKAPGERIQDVAAFSARLREYLRHSQAALLIDRARQHLADAGDGSAEDAGEHFRRAIGCCEQAEELWPRFRAARRMFVACGSASARHALETGAFQLAQRQANAVRAAAVGLGMRDEAQAAGELERQAERAEREREGRARQVRLLRVVASAAMVVAIVGLAWGLVASGRALAEAERQRDKAARALADLEQEQQERQQLARQAAPRFRNEAGDHMRAFRWAEARASAMLAATLDPDDAQGWRLLGEVELGSGAPSAAIPALRRGGAEAAPLLTLAERWHGRLAGRPAEGRQRLELARELKDAGAHLAAGYLRRDSSDGMLAVLEEARERLAAANPRVTTLQWSASVAEDRVVVDCSRNPELTDLTPLEGLQITHLVLARTAVANLNPLKGMPLRELDLAETRVDDLAPLAGMRLEKLVLAATPVTDLAGLTGMPLRSLDLGRTRPASFAVLPSLPLEDLRLGDSGFREPGQIARLKLHTLTLEGLAIRDVAALKNLPLRRLSLARTPVADIAPLAGMAIEWIDLGTTEVADLRPLAGAPLRTLLLAGNRRVQDLSPLAKAPLETLDVRRTTIPDALQLAPFTRLKTLTDDVMPPLALLPPGNDAPTPDQVVQRADELAEKLGAVPALRQRIEALAVVIELARWKRGGGRGGAPGAVQGGRSTFRLIDLPLTAEEGRRLCKTLGGRLATPDSQAALDTLDQAWPAATYHLNASRARGDWRWATGGPLQSGRWAPGQPEANDAAALWLAHASRGWIAVPSSFRASVLVEWTP